MYTFRAANKRISAILLLALVVILGQVSFAYAGTHADHGLFGHKVCAYASDVSLMDTQVAAMSDEQLLGEIEGQANLYIAKYGNHATKYYGSDIANGVAVLSGDQANGYYIEIDLDAIRGAKPTAEAPVTVIGSLCFTKDGAFVHGASIIYVTVTYDTSQDVPVDPDPVDPDPVDPDPVNPVNPDPVDPVTPDPEDPVKPEPAKPEPAKPTPAKQDTTQDNQTAKAVVATTTNDNNGGGTTPTAAAPVTETTPAATPDNQVATLTVPTVPSDGVFPPASTEKATDYLGGGLVAGAGALGLLLGLSVLKDLRVIWWFNRKKAAFK